MNLFKLAVDVLDEIGKKKKFISVLAGEEKLRQYRI